MRDSDTAEGRPLVGDVIAGKYRIESVAGEGGMGIVYEAEHVILRQRVALKVLAPDAVMSAEIIDRFSFEASAIARISCEHVVRVMDAGSLASGAPYLVMEYLEGCDLAKLLAARGPLPSAEVVDYVLQALEALAHAHAARLIHRDLKPANLFLAHSAQKRTILKLLDFGISRSLDTDEDRVAGSPLYMSPEQLQNGVLDQRTDIWSIGVVTYELLAGAPPFVGTFTNIVADILGKDAAPLHERVPGLSADLSAAVGRCMRRDTSERWGSAAELARALVPHGSGAWASSLDRIESVLSRAAPVRAPRRFDTLETALQDLEVERRAGELQTLLPGSAVPSRPVVSAEVFGQTMPAPSAEAAGADVDAPLTSSRKPPLRILLIDDSAFVLGVHAHLLAKAGFAVRSTTSPEEFDALLASFEPHLVLMDVAMPGTSGEVLCRRVKSRFRATLPVVFMSELPRDVLAERAKACGADAFFTKSSDWAAFVDFVRNICAMTYSPEDLP